MKAKHTTMKRELAIVARGVVYVMAIAVFSVCAILLPELAREEAVGKVNPPSALPFLAAGWILSLPIFGALHQTLKLVGYVETNTAFSDLSVKALNKIKIYAIVFSVLIVLGATIVIVMTRIVSPVEDAAPVGTLGFVFTFISSAIATFAAVLERLLHDAIKIKAENDSTI